MWRNGLCLGLVMAAPALAREGPSFDCAKAESSVETLICEDAALSVLDRRMAARYAAALAEAQSLDAGAEAAEKTLRSTQRGWIKGRDDCWKSGDPRGCVEAAYLDREGALVAQWLLEAPSGTAIWICDGNPANEVVTTFFATQRPSLRFGRGDTVDTGSAVPGGTGTRYEGSFGRSILIDGDNATYRKADPDGATFACTLSR